MKHKSLIGRILTVCWMLFMILSLSLTPVSANTDPSPFSATQAGYAGERLEGIPRLFYNYLREQVTKIADGELTSTRLQLDNATLDAWGVKRVWTREELGVSSITEASVDMTQLFRTFMQQLQLDLVIDCLLHDCPYELYWYDKTVGVMQSGSRSWSAAKVEYSSPVLTMRICPDHQVGAYDVDNTEVDQEKVALAKAARENAKAIVAQYAEYSDFEKLRAYSSVICSMVEYDNAAASDTYTGGYGAPWQLVSVFDGNNATKVVCEGYSKAFQYLCELSNFSHGIKCYTVSGTMSGGTGAGNHMWNVVDMGMGSCYLVDVTNSDEDTVGSDGSLFLVGGSGSVRYGYGFTGRYNSRVVYSYGSWSTGIFGTEEKAPLLLDLSDYSPTDVVVILPEHLIYDGSPVTAGRSQGDILYTCVGGDEIADRFIWEHRWLADHNGRPGAELDSAPTEAGTYWIKAIANWSDHPNSEFYSMSEQFTIEKAASPYSSYTDFYATYGDTLADIELPPNCSWKQSPDTSVGDVGVHTVYLSCQHPDTANYAPTEVEIKLHVAQATPTFTVPVGLTASYADRLSDISLPDGFTWKNPTQVIRHTGTQTYLLVYTPTDPNYATVSGISVTVEVSLRDISDVTVELDDAPQYDGTLKTQTVRSAAVNGIDVTYTVTGNSATEIGVYTMTLTGTGSFTGEKKITWRLYPDMNRIEGLSTSNVKSDHKDDIKELKETVAQLDGDWTELTAHLDELLAKIDETEIKVALVVTGANGFAGMEADASQEDVLTAISRNADALLASDNLNAEQRADVSAAKATVDGMLDEIAAARTQMIVIVVVCVVGALGLIIVICAVVSARKKKRA